MILLGVLLVLLAVGAAVWLVLGSQAITAPVNLHTAGIKIGMTPLALLVAGAVILLVLWLGLALIRASVKRRRRPAREARDAQRQAELEENIRADERSRAEESHRNALAERDRVREEEFQSRLVDRDRARDEEERARMSEAEQRIRADERSRVEREYQGRSGEAPAAVGAAGGAGAAGAAEGVGATPHHDSAAEERRYVPADDESTAGGPGDDRGDAGLTESPEPVESADSESSTEPTTESDSSTEADSSTKSDEPHHDRFRTVADKIMGRGPTGEE